MKDAEKDDNEKMCPLCKGTKRTKITDCNTGKESTMPCMECCKDEATRYMWNLSMFYSLSAKGGHPPSFF